MRHSIRRAITLVEMLVAVAIVGIVLAIGIPAVQTLRQAAFRTQCANNLKNLGQAFRNWKDAYDARLFPTRSWVSELSPFVHDAKSVFRCPLDDSARTDAPEAMSIAVFIDGNRTPLRCPEYDNGNIIKIEKDGARSRQATRYGDPGNGAWYAEFELTWNTNDRYNARDWDDLTLLIEPQSNGTSKVSFFRGDVNGTAVSGGNQFFDLLDQNQNPVSSDMRFGQSAFIPGAGSATSYGINSRAHHLELDASKLLLIEYRNTIARVVPPSPTNSELSAFAASVAPRHVAVMNVLYADGHVEIRTVAQIDPRDANLAASMWVP